MNMESWIKGLVFVLGSGGLAWVSRTSLKDPRYHGFYRFFAWEAILLLFLLNVEYWFVQPFSPAQVLSWLLMCTSLWLIFAGVGEFRRKGAVGGGRGDQRLLGIERTTELVTSGVYRFIRHPFYASLMVLAWGIFLKRVSWAGLGLALFASLMLWIMARLEEAENIQYFGDDYRKYMQFTKRFIPFLF